MRRLVTFVLVAAATAAASLWWLHDGDIVEGVQPVLVEWDADTLARNAGIEADAEAPNTP